MNPTPVCRLTNRQILFQSLRNVRQFRGNRPCCASPFIGPMHHRRSVATKRAQDDIASFVEGAPKTKNPMDYVNNPAADAAYRKQIYRRMKWLGGGVAVCLVAQFLIIMAWPSDEELAQRKRNKTNISESGLPPPPSWIPRDRADASNEVNEKFQGKPIQVVGGGAKLVAHDQKTGEDIEVVPTGTSTIPHFPKTIHLRSSSSLNPEDSEYTLLGLGIRTVSFLSIQVYVVGLYVQTSSLSKLQASLVKDVNPTASALIPGEKEKLKSSLLEGEPSYELWDKILRGKASDIETAWRIVPTRNTDFQHLKDGWVRGITAKMQVAQSKGDQEFSDDSFGMAMRDFKGMFTGKGKAPKGSVVLLNRDSSGALDVLFQGNDGQDQLTEIGRIADERVARLIWLGYLGGKSVSSEPARKSVVDGVMELVERPIGSVETKVS